MRMFLALLLTLGWCARAGHPVSLSDTSWPNSTTVSLLPDGIWLRWRASDLASSPVSSWSDELQGWTFVQGTGANQPLWSTNGVQFIASTNFMTTSNLTAVTSVTPGGGGQAWLIVGNYAANTGNHIALGSLTGCGGSAFFYGISSGLIFEGGVGGTVAPTTGDFDFLTAPLSTNSYRAFTNGTSIWTNTAGWNDGVVIARAGGPASGTACNYSGTIKEIIVWTNVIFTTAQVSNIHHYATNTYQFTP